MFYQWPPVAQGHVEHIHMLANSKLPSSVATYILQIIQTIHAN